MQKLLTLSAALACCLAFANTASAQFRDRGDIRFRDRDIDRVRDVVEFRFDTRENRHRARYEFGKRQHLAALITDLYDEANAVCWEMHRNYQNNRGFKTTYAEMYEIRKSAKHIEELVQRSYYRRRNTDDHIARDLHQIDEWFHHVEGDVRNWRSDGRRSFRGGDLTYRMQQFEDTLHHLLEDYGERSRIDRTARRGRDRDHDHDHLHDRR